MNQRTQNATGKVCFVEMLFSASFGIWSLLFTSTSPKSPKNVLIDEDWTGYDTQGVDWTFSRHMSPIVSLTPERSRALNRLCREEFSGGFLKGHEVRHRLQLNRGSQIAAITKEILQATVIKFEKVLQNQASKQLPLRELFRTVLVGILGKNLTGDAPRFR